MSSNLPTCDAVWVAGEFIPEDYEGCNDGGSIEIAATVKCSGPYDDTFVTYNDEFYGFVGGEIVRNEGEPASDPAYAAALEECRASR